MERDGLILALIFYAIGSYILYWIIRSAIHRGVKDALRDHEIWKRSLD